MARARNIKPSFFLNDELAELDPYARLLFIGLWTIADRAGRLKDNPKKIKAAIFPYENIDCNKLLEDLHNSSFIIRYTIDGEKYIQVTNFLAHQNPHRAEKNSAIPEFDESMLQAQCKDDTIMEEEPEENESRRADSFNLIPDSLNLIPDILIPEERENARAKKITPEKTKFADDVFLTDDEYQKLCDRFGEKQTNDQIENLSLWKGSNGKKKKDDYKTLIVWFKRDVDQRKEISEKITTAQSRQMQRYERAGLIKPAERVVDCEVVT